MVTHYINSLWMFVTLMAKKKNNIPVKPRQLKRFEKDLVATVNLNLKLKREKNKQSQKEIDVLTNLNTAKYESGKKDMTISTLGIFGKALNEEPYKFLMK